MPLKYLCLFVLGNTFCNEVQHFLTSGAQLKHAKHQPQIAFTSHCFTSKTFFSLLSSKHKYLVLLT